MADKCSQKDHLKFGDCGTVNCNHAYTMHILKSTKSSAPYFTESIYYMREGRITTLPQNILTVYDIFIYYEVIF